MLKPTPEEFWDEFWQLARQRKYFLEIKIPAMERFLDYIKEKIGPEAGLVPEGPAGCPIGTDPWLAEEYFDLRLTQMEMGNRIRHVEDIARVFGITIEELDNVSL